MSHVLIFSSRTGNSGRRTPAACRFPNALSLLVLVLIAANYFSPFADLDYTWQVRTGERIVRTGSLRPADAFSYTIAGQQVPEFEWLYEVVLYGVWTAFGYGGLKLLRVLLVGSTLLLVGLRLRREGVGRHGVALALIAAVLVVSPAWNLRPLYCTTIGILLLSGWLHDHCTGRRPLPWYMPLAMILWANLHPGVIVGQGLLAGAVGWEWLNRRLRLNPPLNAEAFRRLFVLGALGLLATCISPDPLDRLLYPFRPELAHPIQRAFAEMRPLHAFLVIPPYTAALAYVLATLVGLSVVCRFRQYRLWEVLLLLGLGVLASNAFRSLQDWFLVMLSLGVPHLAALYRQHVWRASDGSWWWRGLLRTERRCKHLFDGGLFRFHWAWPAAGVGVLAAVSLVPTLGRDMPVREGPTWPREAVDWIECRGLTGRFFAPADYGSYVTWRLGDRAKSYVDTRGFFFPPELLEDSHLLPQLTQGWEARLERVCGYGTDYFLLETTGPRGRMWHALEPFVGPPLYLDERCVLLRAEQVRRGAEELRRAQLPREDACEEPLPAGPAHLPARART